MISISSVTLIIAFWVTFILGFTLGLSVINWTRTWAKSEVEKRMAKIKKDEYTSLNRRY